MTGLPSASPPKAGWKPALHLARSRSWHRFAHRVRRILTRKPSIPAARGAFSQPDHVRIVGRRNVERQVVVVLDGWHCARVSPFLDFRVAVREGNRRSAIVVAGWEVDDPGCTRVLDHHIGK